MTEYINKNELLEELKYDRDNDGEIFHSHIEREIHDEKSKNLRCDIKILTKDID